VRCWVARRLVAASSPALTLGISVGGGPGREVFARNSLTAAEAGATDVTSFRKELDMALSDQLTKLAARAKEAEDHAAAAKSKARAFFFQAEDGIRDWSVTGVQTCALPI